MKSFLETALLIRNTLLLLLSTFILFSCTKEEPIAKFDDLSFELQTQDQQRFIFPNDLKGKYTVFGFFYTHCPDICPLMVANMKRVDLALGERSNEVDFKFMSFDPQRDSTEVLNAYFEAFRLDSTRWTFLSGTVDQVEELTKRMGVKVMFQPQKLDETGEPYYLIDHTDKVSIIDERGYVVDHFNASRINPEILAREILKLKDN